MVLAGTVMVLRDIPLCSNSEISEESSLCQLHELWFSRRWSACSARIRESRESEVNFSAGNFSDGIAAVSVGKLGEARLTGCIDRTSAIAAAVSPIIVSIAWTSP